MLQTKMNGLIDVLAQIENVRVSTDVFSGYL